ncbi:Sec-independent protein translocase protein TatAd [bacterium HR30]|nr:Sec-independent protein translocase protein TatAd [bacterium HR30]
MFGIGTPELLVILLVALIVLGPQRLPEIARALGKGLAELRKATSGISNELERARWMLEEEIRAAERAKFGAQNGPRPEATVERETGVASEHDPEKSAQQQASTSEVGQNKPEVQPT